MFDFSKFGDLVKEGALGSNESAVEVCRQILSEGMLYKKDWITPESYLNQAKKTSFAPTPGKEDAGFKMIAKRTDGSCLVCTKPIIKDELIFYKKGKGSTHVSCTLINSYEDN